MKYSFRIGAALAIVTAVGIVAANCGESSSGPDPAPGPTADVTIVIVANNGSMSFSPNPATVTVGQTVSWRNAAGETHTATANEGAFDTGNIAPGGTSAPDSMTTAGSFPYHCAPHPSMTGTLQVNP